MTSFQSELGEGGGIAEELAESQRAISIAEFFEKNKHMLGFDSGARGLVTAVKEAVDNSLTWSTPFVYRDGDETIHRPIGEAVDELIEDNREAVVTKRGGDLEKLRVDGLEALSFDDAYDVDFQRISSVFRHRVNSDVFRITVEGGRAVELTDYHSVFVLRDGEVVSVETSDVDEDDSVVLPDTAWNGANVDRLDFVSELAQLSPEQTEAIGLYGVEQLIDEHYDAIRRQVDAQCRTSDFRNCDRLPFNVVRRLDLDPEAYEDCAIGYRHGRNDVPAVVPVDEHLAELLGVYAAEGCVTGGEREKVCLSLGTHESALIARTERLIRSVFEVSPSTVAAHETATDVTIPSKIVGLLFEEVFDAGTGASEKRVPRYVFDFPRDLRERFLMGYAAGDGCPTGSVIETLEREGEGNIDDIPEDRLALSTSSDRLSSGLQYLLSSIGYDATHERVEAETRTIQGHSAEFGDSHRLYVHTNRSSVSRRRLPAEEEVSSVEDAKLAYDLDGRQDRVDTEHALALADGGSLQFTGNGRAIAESDLTALPVDAVERIEYDREWVYDVSVPGDENFMAGTSPLACHNSLDACEEADVHPDVYVEIREAGDYYTLVVEDNGPGITREQLPKVFGKLLYGSRFHKREQNRGQQGIGISAAVLYSQLTSGKPATVTSRTKGSRGATYYELTIDTDENEPEIKREEELSPAESDLAGQHGTRIEMEMEANMRARSQLHDYIEGTAVVNPHARIELVEPGLDEPLKYERVGEASLPAETSEIRPHPHGVELGAVRKMLEATASHSVSGFLQEEFTRVGRKTATSVIDEFRDRQYGREVAYRPPLKTEEADLEPAVRAAVSNKRRKATRAFARDVADRTDDHERVAHHELRETVATAADRTEDDFDTRFGDTVREKATAAAWRTLVGGDDGTTDRRAAEFYRLVDSATTDRKSDATIERLAERLATRIAGQDDGRDRVTRTNLREYVDWAADGVEEHEAATVGDTARENVVEEVWAIARTVPKDPPKVRHLAEDRDAVSDLVDAMRATDIMAPPTDCLAPIGADDIEAGLRKGYDADFYAAASRDAEVSGGDPFVVEAGIAYGGDIDDGPADVLRFANRVPLVYQRGACAITDVVKSIGWRNYELDQPGGSGVPNGPAVVMVHVASTNVPFTSESKDAVANVPEIESEIELAVREAARELKSFLKRRQSMQQRQRKRDVLTEILPEMADKVAEVTGRDRPNVEDAMARIMGNVLVDRAVETSGDTDRVEITVENHSDTAERLEVTDIVDAEPRELDGATAVAMDGEQFVRWDVDVGAGETARLTYAVPAGTASEVTVDGVESAKLTVSGDGEKR